MEEKEIKFNELIAISKRIINAKNYLFTGNPYTTRLKPNKLKTFKKLCKMLDQNIKQVSELLY